MKAITRFAPSPTGYIHIGNVRSAIYPYLVAHQTDGKMILRIEDTDRERYVEGATELIEDTLKWLGLDWDEGPIVGGPNEPYFQSERTEIYLKWAKKLLESGRAYADPTPSEKIDEYRKECNEKKVPFLYRNFRPENPPEWEPGMPIRFKAEPKTYEWHDAVMGDMKTGPEVLDDIILIKKDGFPTYNFAHIVDDAEMNITHVMRGVEYLSSTPNYLAIYEALGLVRPVLVSLPHILAPTGNKKLGKRDGAKSVTEYRDDGVLPEAMLNYLACLGWNDGTEQEIYTKDELIQKFSIDRIQNSGARYDETKLLWMNGQWIRKIYAEQGARALYDRTVWVSDGAKGETGSFWPAEAESWSEDYRIKVLSIIYDRLKTLSDLREMTRYFFADPEIDTTMLTENKFLKKMSEAEIEGLLKTVIAKLSAVSAEEWNAEKLQEVLNELLEDTGKKPAELFSLIRIAVSFAAFSPALNLTLEVLGREVSLARLNAVARSI
ncbi:glutamate--tRNA ligase [Candidatus Saccharibacteria bacterium]|nr:glutamate--tRNA ligase [Candidatus Saccharibacteria bacterium]